MKIPKYPITAVKHASWRNTLWNQAGRIRDYGKSIVYHEGKFNPLKAVPRALKRGYDSTAVATSPMKRKNMTADALENMLHGRHVDDVATRDTCRTSYYTTLLSVSIRPAVCILPCKYRSSYANSF